MNWDHHLKIILIGDNTAGKTSFLRRYMDNDFGPDIIVGTSGACHDFRHDYVKYLDKTVRLQIWDTYCRYCCFGKYQNNQRHYRNVDIVVILFDLAKPISIERLERFNNEIEENKHVLNKFYRKILVGTKVDLIDSDNIDLTQIYSFCEKYGYKYMSTSAKEDIGIKSIFDQTVNNVLTDKLFDSKNKI